MSESNVLGTVASTAARQITVHVKPDEHVLEARIGQLVALDTSKDDGGFLVGLVDRLTSGTAALSPPDAESDILLETECNLAYVTLVGRVNKEANKFYASFVHSPAIGAQCKMIIGKDLEDLTEMMSVGICIGRHSRFPEYKAYIDADHFFQRHAAILGSTGAGKSWTVAALIEKMNRLKSGNCIVFDLHGEYKTLERARHLRIPGPSELASNSGDMLWLPYWLLNGVELQSMFIDSSEFSAHNQIAKFNLAVLSHKPDEATLDSPVPFSMYGVTDDLRVLNEQMVRGVNKEKKGPYHGDFTRLLTRMDAKLTDARLGFMMNAPDYSLGDIVAKLMDFSTASVRVIDFSQVPSDILPIVVSLVARLVYDVNFWTKPEQRHPLAFICDEAHVYLSRRQDKNPVEKRAAAMFDRIAKEGRKYGVSLVVVSQRPSDLSATILSQCNNLLVMRMSNRDDLSTVAARVPSGLDSLLDALPVLDVGEAVVLGDAVALPSRIMINPPLTPPASETVDLWSEWSRQTDEPNFEAAIDKMQRR